MPDLVEKYIATLTEKECIVLEIAKEYLGSSFDISINLGAAVTAKIPKITITTTSSIKVKPC